MRQKNFLRGLGFKYLEAETLEMQIKLLRNDEASKGKGQSWIEKHARALIAEKKEERRTRNSFLSTHGCKWWKVEAGWQLRKGTLVVAGDIVDVGISYWVSPDYILRELGYKIDDADFQESVNDLEYLKSREWNK